MPYKYVYPEKFLSYDGVDIFHVYKHGDWGNRMRYWFTTDISEDEAFSFDVRELPGANPERIYNDDEIRELLISAIDEGFIEAP